MISELDKVNTPSFLKSYNSGLQKKRVTKTDLESIEQYLLST